MVALNGICSKDNHREKILNSLILLAVILDLLFFKLFMYIVG